jgi:hypothetical protein
LPNTTPIDRVTVPGYATIGSPVIAMKYPPEAAASDIENHHWLLLAEQVSFGARSHRWP